MRPPPPSGVGVEVGGMTVGGTGVGVGVGGVTVGGRVRGRRLDLGVADPLLSVSCESASVPSPCLVSIPCHLEPDMRFSLIRLSDNLLLGAFKLLTIPILITCHIRPDQNALSLLALKYSLR